MRRLLRIVGIITGTPIGVLLFLSINIFATLLWPIFLIGFVFDYVIRKCFTKKIKMADWLEYMEDTILSFYGFSFLWLALPFYIADQGN